MSSHNFPPGASQNESVDPVLALRNALETGDFETNKDVLSQLSAEDEENEIVRYLVGYARISFLKNDVDRFREKTDQIREKIMVAEGTIDRVKARFVMNVYFNEFDPKKFMEYFQVDKATLLALLEKGKAESTFGERSEEEYERRKAKIEALA